MRTLLFALFAVSGAAHSITLDELLANRQEGRGQRCGRRPHLRVPAGPHHARDRRSARRPSDLLRSAARRSESRSGSPGSFARSWAPTLTCSFRPLRKLG